MMTVRQPNNCLCLGPSVEHKKTSTLPINSWYLLMGPHKLVMALIYQKNGSYLTANPLSPSSVTIDSSGTSVNPTGGCTSILQISCHWLTYANGFMSTMTVPNRMNLWFTSQMGLPSSSFNWRGNYTTLTLHPKASL